MCINSLAALPLMEGFQSPKGAGISERWLAAHRHPAPYLPNVFCNKEDSYASPSAQVSDAMFSGSA